jgi:hypothetical protein
VTGSEKNPSHTITIARPAVAAHLAHGDTEGECAETTTTTAAATTTTSASQSTTTTSRVKKPKPVHTSSHAKTTHTSHGKSGQSSHGNSGSSHGNGGGKGNGHGK